MSFFLEYRVKIKIKPNSKAMDTMGKDLWNNCFLITQDLLESPEEMNYVCSKVNKFEKTI